MLIRTTKAGLELRTTKTERDRMAAVISDLGPLARLDSPIDLHADHAAKYLIDVLAYLTDRTIPVPMA